MKCKHDSCEVEKLFARGYCQKHYWQLRKAGELQRVNIVNSGTCSEPGCQRTTFAKNLCTMHYQRQQPAIYNTWRSIRNRYPGEYPDSWKVQENFILDVGERPSDVHQLRRINPNLPWSKENCYWLKSVADTQKVSAAEYAKRWDLRKKYDMTMEDFNTLLMAQDGRCAICKCLFSSIDPATSKPYKICVDHDHVTGKVRGLLCDPCNKGLGSFQDNIQTMETAIAYLKAHAT